MVHISSDTYHEGVIGNGTENEAIGTTRKHGSLTVWVSLSLSLLLFP